MADALTPVALAEAKCIFCGKQDPLDDSLDGQLLEVEVGQEWGFVHYNCATWTPEVSVDDDGTFRGMEKGFRRGRKLVRLTKTFV
jgi:hypothetical protein